MIPLYPFFFFLNNTWKDTEQTHQRQEEQRALNSDHSAGVSIPPPPLLIRLVRANAVRAGTSPTDTLHCGKPKCPSSAP